MFTIEYRGSAYGGWPSYSPPKPKRLIYVAKLRRSSDFEIELASWSGYRYSGSIVAVCHVDGWETSNVGPYDVFIERHGPRSRPRDLPPAIEVMGDPNARFIEGERYSLPDGDTGEFAWRCTAPVLRSWIGKSESERWLQPGDQLRREVSRE